MKTQRLEQPHQRMKLRCGRIHPLLRARMRRNDHGQLVVLGQRIQHHHQFGKRLVRLDVFLAMGTHHEVLALLQFQPGQHV